MFRVIIFGGLIALMMTLTSVEAASCKRLISTDTAVGHSELKDAWAKIVGHVNLSSWQKADTDLAKLRKHPAVTAKNAQRLADFQHVLKFTIDPQIVAENDFTQVMQELVESRGKGQLWIQKCHFPDRNKVSELDGFIKKEAKKNLKNDYLSEHVAGFKSTDWDKYKNKIKVDEVIKAAQVIYMVREGNALEAWVAYYLDSKKIRSRLKVLTQLKNPDGAKSSITVGVFGEKKVAEMIDISLQQQGITYRWLGTNYNQKKVKDVNTVMTVVVENNTAKKAATMSVDVTLKVYDTLDQKPPKELTTNGKYNSMNIFPAVKKAYKKIKFDLLSVLWEENFKKEDKQLELDKRDKAAAEKAERLDKAARDKAKQAEKLANEKKKAEAKEAEEDALERSRIASRFYDPIGMVKGNAQSRRRVESEIDKPVVEPQLEAGNNKTTDKNPAKKPTDVKRQLPVATGGNL